MFLGKTTFQQAVTSAWAPTLHGLIATGTLDGGGVGFGEDEANLCISEVDMSTGSLREKGMLKVPGTRFAALDWGGESNDCIAGGMIDGSVRLWSYKGFSLQESQRFTPHDKGSAVKALQFNPASKQILAHGSSDKKVMISDLSAPGGASTTSVTVSHVQHSGEVSSIAWNIETSHILASSSMDGVCSVWDTKSKKSFCDIRDPRGASTVVVAWSPLSGYNIITGSDSGYLRLFDLRSSKTTPLAEWQPHQTGVFDISWCPQDAGYLASCGKDNRLVVWDLYTLQPVQEVTAESSLSPKQAGAGKGFHFDKGHANIFGGSGVNVSSDALFSGSAESPGLAGGSGASARRYQIDWSPSVPGVLSACSFDRSVQIMSLVAAASMDVANSGTKVRAPSWMGRRAGASFGFGGRLVSCRTVANVGPEVELKNCHEALSQNETSAASHIAEFERSLNQAVQHDAPPSHDHLAAFCAERASKSETGAEQEIWKFMRVLFAEDNPRVAVQKYLGYDEEAVAREVDLSFLPPAEEPQQTQEEAPVQSIRENDRAEEALPSDELIMKALTVGNFEAAVALCFEHQRPADALFISSLGGAPLMKRAHRAYLDSQTPKRRLMRLARSIFDDNTQGTVVRSSDLSKQGAWKQTLAFLMSYTRPEDFPSQCDALALRLEHETNDISAATICYMLSRNVEKSGELWTRINPKSDVSLVEKAIVFQRVLPNPHALHEDRLMMQRFARLAARLADEGEFEIATKYATMASSADYEASELVQRLQCGLQWTASTEQRVLEEERARAAADADAAATAALAQHQQQSQNTQRYVNGGAYSDYSGGYDAYSGGHVYSNPSNQFAGGHSTYMAAPPHSAPMQPAVGGYPAPAYSQSHPSGYSQQPTTYTHVAPAYAPASAPSQTFSLPSSVPSTYAPAPLSSFSAPPSHTYTSPMASPPSASSFSGTPAAFAPNTTPPPPPTAAVMPAAPAQTSALMAPPPRVKENDGFGSTAGNPDAGAKYGNRSSFGAPLAPQAAHTPQTSQQPPQKPQKVPDSMLPALQSIQRMLTMLKAKYPSGMEERRLKEAEKGEQVLRAALAVGSLSEFFQTKLKEMAAAFDRGAYTDAHNIQITLSSVDWKEHKDWLKGIGHLIAVAQKDAAPSTANSTSGSGVPAGPVMPPPATYGPTGGSMPGYAAQSYSQGPPAYATGGHSYPPPSTGLPYPHHQ